MIGPAVFPRFLAAADSALLVELGDAISAEATAAVLSLDAHLAATPPAGVLAVLPALRSVLLEYDPLRTSQQRLRHDVEALLALPAVDLAHATARHHEITVRYGGDDGPDLDAVAQRARLDAGDVVRLHSGATYRVAMLGNQPGLPYLLGLDPRLDVPRRDDPRDTVAAGSVAVAGGLGCVYPVAGPAGWNVVGRTAAALFDPQRTPPALLAPGDTVRFVPVASGAVDDAGPGTNSASEVDPDGPALLVVDPGLLTTVQDMGRHGHQRDGVPVCGALDSELLRVANLLVGNPPGAAALEVTHAGPLLEVRAPSARLAVAGGGEVTRIGRDGSEHALGSWRSTILREGERLRVGRANDGLRCVVAVEGGIAVAPVLGSRSTYLRSGFGGLRGRALQRGDLLPLHRAYAGHHPDVRLDRATVHDAGLSSDAGTPVSAVAGPQDDWVTREALDALFTKQLTVSPRSDRAGLRLDGIRLHHERGAEIISDGCAAGSIQVPGNGAPIVLLADRGTTGGYPKVATVASAHLPRLARLRPGGLVRLRRVSVEEAEGLRRERERALAGLADHLDPVAAV